MVNHGPIPQVAYNILARFYRDQAIAKHEADKKSWPWWARFLHRWLRSRGCEACKAAKQRDDIGDAGQ